MIRPFLIIFRMPYKHHSLLNLALVLSIFMILSSSCRDEIQHSRHNSGDLFTPPPDTLLLAPVTTEAKVLPVDSAFRLSTIVAVGSIYSIDSQAHGGERAPFFLVTAVADTFLSGDMAARKKKLYFICTSRPAFLSGDQQRWLLFLEPPREQRLLAKGPVSLRWTENAPFIRFTEGMPLPVITQYTPGKKTKKYRRKKRRHLHHHVV